MENQDVELARFRLKAQGYRKAMSIAPEARSLEIFAIACILRGYCDELGLSRKDLIVVDLMAGTGFLSEQLYQFGFRKLHALEACNEMSQQGSGGHPDRNFNLYPFADIDGVQLLLRRIKPHVVVSIAGFHHLIKYAADGAVDAGGSVELQEQMAKACMEALGDDAMCLIVDIYEDSLGVGVPEQWPYWRKASASRWPSGSAEIPPAVKDSLLNATTFREFSAAVTNQLCSVSGPANPSLAWFREVVDKLSSVGHKDIALSQPLLDKLSAAYRVSFATTPCPWLFANDVVLQKFLTTFWFDESKDVNVLSRINSEAARVNGIQMAPTCVTFGWNLGYLIVEANTGDGRAVARAASHRMAILASVLLALSATNILFKLLSYWSVLYGFMDNAVSAALALLMKEVVAAWQRRLEQSESKRLH